MSMVIYRHDPVIIYLMVLTAVTDNDRRSLTLLKSRGFHDRQAMKDCQSNADGQTRVRLFRQDMNHKCMSMNKKNEYNPRRGDAMGSPCDIPHHMIRR
jgi:hypothetical protein